MLYDQAIDLHLTTIKPRSLIKAIVVDLSGKTSCLSPNRVVYRVKRTWRGAVSRSIERADFTVPARHYLNAIQVTKVDVTGNPTVSVGTEADYVR